MSRTKSETIKPLSASIADKAPNALKDLYARVQEQPKRHWFPGDEMRQSLTLRFLLTEVEEKRQKLMHSLRKYQVVLREVYDIIEFWNKMNERYNTCHAKLLSNVAAYEDESVKNQMYQISWSMLVSETYGKVWRLSDGGLTAPSARFQTAHARLMRDIQNFKKAMQFLDEEIKANRWIVKVFDWLMRPDFVANVRRIEMSYKDYLAILRPLDEGTNRWLRADAKFTELNNTLSEVFDRDNGPKPSPNWTN